MEQTKLEHLVRDHECRGKDSDYRPVFDKEFKVTILIDPNKGTAYPLCPYIVRGPSQICHAAAVPEKRNCNYSFPACTLGKD